MCISIDVSLCSLSQIRKNENWIISDAVFGSHLMSLYIKEDGKVPHFVMGCIAAIEDRGE